MRFGVEIELDALDGRDLSVNPLLPGEMPSGYDLVTQVVSDLGLAVESHGWKHNHNNSVWVCKPDSSCGIELCSPVLDERRMDEVLLVVDALNDMPHLTSGPNCALHVHVDVSSLVAHVPEMSEDICAVLAWWVKCEPVILDSVPARRKNNRFCRCIGMTDIFDHDEMVVPFTAVSKLSEKYLTLNTHHMMARRRNSIEFRILEGTKDASLVESWLKFVLNFVRKAKSAGVPSDYRWVSAEDVHRLIDSGPCSRWLSDRIAENIMDAPEGFWRTRAEFESLGANISGVFGRKKSCGIGFEVDK